MIHTLVYLTVQTDLNKKVNMEKRVLGIFLSLIGIIGLIYAGLAFMDGNSNTRNIKMIIVAGILGGVFFIAGVSLVGNTKDKET